MRQQPQRATRPVPIRLQYSPQHLEWDRVRTRLTEFPASFYPPQMVKLVACCRQSATLRRVIPYVSLGRLGFGLPGSRPSIPLLDDTSPCVYFNGDYYVVSSYDNVTQWLFPTASAAIVFVEQHVIAVPRKQG